MWRLIQLVPIGSSASRYSSLARFSYRRRSSCSAASRSRCFTAGSDTATNVHGCWFAPEGAVAAVRIAFSISSCGTSSGEKWRTDRRVAISSRNSRERRSASSASRRVNSSGTGVYGSFVLTQSTLPAEEVSNLRKSSLDARRAFAQELVHLDSHEEDDRGGVDVRRQHQEDRELAGGGLEVRDVAHEQREDERHDDPRDDDEDRPETDPALGTPMGRREVDEDADGDAEEHEGCAPADDEQEGAERTPAAAPAAGSRDEENRSDDAD